ncbi:Aminodeoxychorismate synthase component 1 [Vibrio quintilis]|uniref:aminodeoxychorismate synthase n=2 Tax=Vibrio quintilis TaxID=1117707 RepID=A0A1M7Z2N5_9VIBR|nr:Aminodeoxychorismate synthase component 1 [Vibrio quintilis]
MLLKSSSDAHCDSRFDILVANPVATLVTRDQITTIREMTGEKSCGNPGQKDPVKYISYQSDQDPFSLLDEIQKKWTPAIQSERPYLPFTGGALGYFAYDLGRRIEKLPETADHDIPLPEMAVGIYTWALIVDHQEKQAWWTGQDTQAAEAWILAQQPSPDAPFQLKSCWQSNMTRALYQNKFEAIQAYLQAGDCYQINLTQRFQAEYRGSEWQAFNLLDQSNEAPFSAFLRLDEGAILSLSPERFLQLKNRHIETKPIKGTIPRAEIPADDRLQAETLRQSPKDQAENLMIVDLLRNDIGRVALPGSVCVPKLFDIETFPYVHHLVSTIHAKLDQKYSASDLIRACFPGGSITGAPKVRAMEIIEELEPHRRNAYCGSIGYISRNGQMDTSITIRTLIATGQQLYVWAGGGIVADSQWKNEYQETLDKLSRILPVLRPQGTE